MTTCGARHPARAATGPFASPPASRIDSAREAMTGTRTVARSR